MESLGPRGLRNRGAGGNKVRPYVLDTGASKTYAQNDYAFDLLPLICYKKGKK